MENLPCKNPNCKSNGRPHPNCKCYAEMAEGGEVKHFCETSKPHDKACTYYAEGGEASSEGTPTWESTEPVEQKEPTFEETNPVEPTYEDTSPVDDGSEIVNIGPYSMRKDGKPQEPTWESTEGKYDSQIQQLGAGLEGAAQGFAGPVATLAEQGLSKLGVPGLTDEDIKGRQEANPWAHGIGETAGLGIGLATGLGEAALVGKAAVKLLPEAIPILGKIGATALKAFTTNASIAAGNETTKAMLGQGDPEHPVAAALANVGIAGLLGSLFEGGTAAVAATEGKLGSKAASWLAGFGAKASGKSDAVKEYYPIGEMPPSMDPVFKAGYKAYEKAINAITSGVASSINTGIAIKSGGLSLPAVEFIQGQLKKYIGKPINRAGELTVPVVTKWLSEGAPSGLIPILDYASKIERGNKLLNRSVETLFKEGVQSVSPPIGEATRSLVDNWIGNGGVDHDVQKEMHNQSSEPAQGYAEGGDVKKTDKDDKTPGVFHDHPIATMYPEQNMMLQTTKGRISNYLRALRPQENTPRLAFDPEPDMRKKKKAYDKAMDIAIQPMSILEKIKKGTIDMDHIQHFNAMYPELNGVIQKKVAEQVADSQLKGKKPNYAIRQGLSLLTGTSLTSTMTPQNIQAAQAVFQMQKAASQPQGQAAKPKSSNKSLSKSSQSFLTGNQSLIGRQQRQG